MFESVSSRAFHRAARATFVGALPVSIFVHAVALLAVPVFMAWEVAFPTQAPAMIAMYSLVEPPAPPPPPPPPPKPQQASLVKPEDRQKQPSEIVAPSIIPDQIPILTAEPEVQGGMDGGVEGGVEGGTTGGAIGGTFGGVAGLEEVKPDPVPAIVTPPVDDGRVVIERDKPLRMAPLSQTFPIYPERARLQGWEDQNVVRYVIGKDGRVKEVTILDPADRKIFDEATVKAIRYWRFRPMVKDGEAKEVVHELTIRYRLTV